MNSAFSCAPVGYEPAPAVGQMPMEMEGAGGAGTVPGFSGRLGQPLLMAATFAAGAGAALGAKALLDSRRPGSAAGEHITAFVFFMAGVAA